MSKKKPFRYYHLNFSGRRGSEGYPAGKRLKKARLCSVHDYGMVGGDLFRLVRSVRSLEEIKRIVRKHNLPALVEQVSPDEKTIRNRTVAQEFTRRRTSWS